MYKLVRAYYRWLKNVAVAGNVDLEGDLSGIRDSQIKFVSSAKVRLGRGVHICNSKIEVIGGELVVEDGVRISDYSIQVDKGCRLYIGKDCVLEQGDNWRKPYILMCDESRLTIANNNRLRCDVHCRFCGLCEVGEYNCINERTEIRCDESVKIGSFNMISYNCRIWDTNTHAFYEDDTRRKMTRESFPYIGGEKDKPRTKPVLIGCDDLLGENSAILKGSIVGNKVRIGYGAIISNKVISDNCVAF